MAGKLVDIEIDDSQFQTKLRQFLMIFKKAVPLSEEDAANELLRLSQEQVPLDEGTLLSSGAVDRINGDFVVGYHTPYAARLHEHPEYHFHKGRKGKYLIDPLIDNRAVLGLRFNTKMQRVTGVNKK